MKFSLFLPLIFLSCLFCINSSLNGQSDHHEHRCSNDQLQERLYVQYPELRERQRLSNERTHELMYGSASHFQQRAAVVYTIPVVVHVVHKVGTSVGTNENISDAQINQAIADLNAAFRNTGFYDPATGADAEIEFCLAAQDPSGNFTNGITRTANDTYTDLDSDTEDAALKSTIAPQWDATKYCNIWIVDQICSSVNGGCSTAGYAYLSSSHGTALDGIVNEDDWFGSSQTNSKVHIHEMGHYLNLYHTNNGGCINNDCTTDGDFVCDTPPDNSSSDPGFGCLAQNSCATDIDDVSTNNPFRPIGLGGLGDQNDMIENYMDLSRQSCQNRFTAGQVSRMRTALTVDRASLLTSPGCINPSSPEIYFASAETITTETRNVTLPNCFNYKDITVTMNIGAAPVGAATITIAYAGSALNGTDYSPGTAPEITFPSGSTNSQSFNIRIWDDIAVEETETIVLTYSISGTTNAIAGSFNQTHTISIANDDLTPDVAGKTVLLDEGFDSGIPSDWGEQFFACPCMTGDLVWEAGTAGLSGNSAYISEDGTSRADNLSDARRLGLTTKLINATGITQDIFLEFDLDIGGDATNDYLEIFYKPEGASWIIWLGPIHSFSGTYSVTLPSAIQNTNFQLSFNWRSNGDGSMNGAVPSLDNIRVFTGDAQAEVETDMFSFDAPLNAFDTVYVYNGFGNQLVAQVVNLSAWNYGCTTFSIDRSGNGAMMFQNNNPASFATEKTLLITPTNNNPSGNYRIRFYYSAAEIAGWESATGESRNSLGLFKAPGAISTGSGLASFGTDLMRGSYNTNDFYVQADFNSGFSGFASASILRALPVELIDFRGEIQKKSAELSWQTLSEKDNAFFTLEHSTGHLDYSAIATLDGAGTSSDPKKYSFHHQNPSEGINYYRLKQTDNNGITNYVGKIIALNFAADFQMSLQPNPVKSDQLYFNFYNEEPEQVLNLQIFSVDGRLVKTVDFILQNGVNRKELNISQLGKGVYILKIEKNQMTESLRFVRM